MGISQAPSWGWGSARVIGLLTVGVVLAVVWVFVESRSAQPLIDMQMMRLPAVWTTNLVALLFGAGMYATFAFLPEFLQSPSAGGYGFGASVAMSGLIMLPSSVATFALGIMSGRLSERFGSKAVLVTGATIGVVTFALLTFAHAAVWQIVLAMVVQGIGFGLAFAAMSNLIVAAVPAHQTGVASGMNANIRTIGGAIGAAVVSTVITSGAGTGGLPAETGYTPTALRCSSFCAGGSPRCPPRPRRTSRTCADRSGAGTARRAGAGRGRDPRRGGVRMSPTSGPAVSAGTVPTCPLRRDAAHNRDQILVAAAEVFAAEGLGASVEEIARVAGVGDPLVVAGRHREHRSRVARGVGTAPRGAPRRPPSLFATAQPPR